VADAQFLIGWGWMPLFREIRGERFLEDSELLAKATKRLLGEFEIIPMDYIQSAGTWKNNTINEAGFGTEGLAELYQVMQDSAILNITRVYMDGLLAGFQQSDGFWARAYSIETREKGTGLVHGQPVCGPGPGSLWKHSWDHISVGSHIQIIVPPFVYLYFGLFRIGTY